MSAPLKLTAQELRFLGEALDAATKVTHSTGIRLDGYDRLRLTINSDVTLEARWDENYGSQGGYVIDDWYGS